MQKQCPECEIYFECKNAGRVFCNYRCQARANKKANFKEKCPACAKPVDEWGKDYKYLCTNCELLAFNGDNEEII